MSVECKFFNVGKCRKGASCQFGHLVQTEAKVTLVRANTVSRVDKKAPEVDSSGSTAPPAKTDAAVSTEAAAKIAPDSVNKDPRPRRPRTRSMAKICRVCNGNGKILNPNASDMAFDAGEGYDSCTICNGTGVYIRK